MIDMAILTKIKEYLKEMPEMTDTEENIRSKLELDMKTVKEHVDELVNKKEAYIKGIKDLAPGNWEDATKDETSNRIISLSSKSLNGE